MSILHSAFLFIFAKADERIEKMKKERPSRLRKGQLLPLCTLLILSRSTRTVD